MPRMSITWTLSGKGWADCLVTDGDTQAQVTASYITLAPDELLQAVTRVVVQEGETQAEFEAEPTVFRWIFYRDGDHVRVDLFELGLRDRAWHGKAGTQIWSSQQTIDTVARAFIRGFDDVVAEHGESRYQDSWGHPFPRAELERLRSAWRRYKATSL